MVYLTQGSVPPRNSSLLVLCDLVSMCRWTLSHVQCQRAKIQRHSTGPLASFRTPDARFDVIHLDLVGPLPPSHGYTYLLTCVDHFIRWPEATTLTSITAETVSRALLSGWITCFGVPSTIVTDRGRQFESQVWNTLTTLFGSRRAHSTAYHPQTNGMVERFHRQLNSELTCRLFTLLHLAPPSKTATSSMVCQLPHTCLSGMMLSANHSNHHMTDHTQSSNERTSTSPSISMVVRTPSPLIVSNLLTSTQTACTTLHKP